MKKIEVVPFGQVSREELRDRSRLDDEQIEALFKLNRMGDGFKDITTLIAGCWDRAYVTMRSTTHYQDAQGLMDYLKGRGIKLEAGPIPINSDIFPSGEKIKPYAMAVQPSISLTIGVPYR
ncbi:MAG: hypothetical protein AABX64_01165 [Nanoarchaeota archaeon]